MSSGQILVLQGTNAGNTIGGTNIKTSGAFTLGINDTMTLIWDGTNWIELTRSINAD